MNYIIVGQGLAGSAIAMQLRKRGYKVLVFDERAKNTSSIIAAGLYNPVTGKNMAKTWLADEVFSALDTFYREAEQLTGVKFYYPTPLFRPFRSVEEQNEWMGRSADKIYTDYIESISVTSGFRENVKNPFGGVTLKKTGFVETPTYLDAIRRYLVSIGAFQEQNFDQNALEIRENSVCYHNITAEKIIFCQGVHNMFNPWFNHLPIIPLKGETLSVQCDREKDVILNRGVYLVPGRDAMGWRVGATYNLKDKEPGITKEARTELTDKLNDLIDFPYTITGQQWGFRPTTPDRKPILGFHPNYRPLIIFNGLGTKGVSLAPYFSAVLVRAIENKGTINREADVTRFN